MKRTTGWVTRSIARSMTILVAVAAAAPAWAVSLAPTGPAQPPPDLGVTVVSLPDAQTVTAGSGSLVPLMAADAQEAAIDRALDAGTPTGGGDIGKPVDDISFLVRATESAREEINAVRDALPQFKDLGLKRVAEALIHDHSVANARMARLAEEKKWPLPPQTRLQAPAAGTANADFDANWIDDMILAHERSLALYSAQAQGGEDADLRLYAREALPRIQHHLAELRRLQK